MILNDYIKIFFLARHDWPMVEVAAERGVVDSKHLHCPLHPVKRGALPHKLGGPPHGGGGGGGRAELDRYFLRGVGQLDHMPDTGPGAILQPGTSQLITRIWRRWV
jgi:hypothetical protein